MKFDIFKLSGVVAKIGGKTLLKLRKNAPTIMIVTGVAGAVGSTVMACKATINVQEDIESTNSKIEHVKGLSLPECEMKKEVSHLYLKLGTKLAKAYAPAVALGVTSYGLIAGSHGVMLKRNASLVAAYNVVDKAYSEYRKRVVDEIGEDKERAIRYNLSTEKITETEVDPDTGKNKKVKKDILIAGDDTLKQFSQYAVVFDNTCEEWTNDAEYNKSLLLARQGVANQMLHSRGHVFLNEIYDMIGAPRTKAGQIVGWVLGHGDDFIDFGLTDINYKPARDFMNGYEKNVIIDPNVDGVIYDLI